MATAGGPKIVTDGLVFGYDTNYGVADNTTATRFYPGENTVNYTTDTASQGGWGGSYNVVDSSRKKFRLNVSNFNGNPGAGWRAFTWDLRAYTGQSVTISATVEVPASSPGTFAWIMMGQTNTHTSNGTGAGMYMGYSASGERVQKTTTTKERITWSGTLGNSGTASQPSGHVGFTVWYNNGVPGTNSYVEVSDVQIELKSHETPFVDGTRSSTSSLVDLKRTTSIDVSNVSFDSTGQPTFDGSDDIIDLTLPQNFQDKLTIETWYKGTDSSRNHLWNFTGSGNLNCNFNDGGYTLWLYWDGGGSNYLRFTTPQFCDSEIHHIVFVHEGSTNKVYLDGVLLTNGVAGGTQTFNSKMGSTYDVGGTRYFQGDVYVNRVYNKALTAADVKQNFNAYKNRFDI